MSGLRSALTSLAAHRRGSRQRYARYAKSAARHIANVVWQQSEVFAKQGVCNRISTQKTSLREAMVWYVGTRGEVTSDKFAGYLPAAE